MENQRPTFEQTHPKPAIPVRIDGFLAPKTNKICIISAKTSWPIKLAALDRVDFFLDDRPFLGNIKVEGMMFRLSDIPDELMNVYAYGEQAMAERVDLDAGRKVFPNELVTVVLFTLDDLHMRSFKNYNQNEVRKNETKAHAEAKAEAGLKQKEVLTPR